MRSNVSKLKFLEACYKQLDANNINRKIDIPPQYQRVITQRMKKKQSIIDDSYCCGCFTYNFDVM